MKFVNNFLTHVCSAQFIKFCVVGAIAAAINFSLYIALVELLDWWYIFSSVTGFVVSAIFNFTVNKFWTFKNGDHGRDAVIQSIKFFTVTTAGLLMHTALIYAITDVVKIDYRISWVIATGIVTIWNYSLNKLWTFKEKRLDL